MEEFDDEFGDFSQFKTITFKEMNKGFIENKNAFENTIINKNNSPEFRSKFHDYRNTPLGYSYLTDDPVSVFPSTGIDENGKKGYEYRAAVLPCKNGSQVLGSYNTNNREPQSLFLFYEKSNPKKSNFAGDFYAAKMGDYFVSLFKRFPEPLPAKIGGKFFKNITSMEDEAGYLAQLAYTYEGDKIIATLVRDALMREYQYHTGEKVFDEILGSISSIPADAIGWCAKQLEDFKPNEKNYDPASKDYSPLIPVFANVSVPVNMNKTAQFFEDFGSNPFVQDTENAFAQVWELVKQSASKVKDASIDHLPDSFKKLVTKITGIINSIKTFLSEIKDIVTDLAEKGIELLKILNAFNCGVMNGLVGLVQCILYILEFLLQPTITFSYEQYLERRDLLEKAEDVLDWVHENVPVFLEGVKNLFSSSGGFSQANIEGIFDKLKGYWDNVSHYTIAFYVGVFTFEVLINILLLVFTEGAGNVVKGTTYVQKAASLLKVLARESVSVATLGITDLLAFLSKFMIRFGKACVKGFKGLMKFIEELLQGFKNGAKLEDLAEKLQDIEEVVITANRIPLLRKSYSGLLVILPDLKFAQLAAAIEAAKISIRFIKNKFAYTLVYKGVEVYKGTLRGLRKEVEKLEEIRKEKGIEGVEKYLDDLLPKHFNEYLSFRKLYIGKSADELLMEFKEVIKPKHFKLEDLGDFYYQMKRKYPKLTQGRNKNFAEFVTTIKKKGKRTRQIKELSHSGEVKMYDHFIDNIKHTDFLNGARDAKGAPKHNDSEIKWIYNFLAKHIDEGDEFIVESKNIFYACSSCQRELIIFKKYLESIGKKLDITIFGDETVVGTQTLLNKIKNNKNKWKYNI